VHSHYLSQPLKYLSHLIGHESGGSILALLKQKTWANGLSSYLYSSTNDFACFSISIELTEVGLDFIDDIVEVVFTYIGFIIILLLLLLLLLLFYIINIILSSLQSRCNVIFIIYKKNIIRILFFFRHAYKLRTSRMGF
jgi:hypothetical protein